MATVAVINGVNRGDWYTLGGNTMVFGRDSSLLAEMLDRCVSRRHMEIRPDSNGGFEVVDLGSRNGVLVNSERVNRTQTLEEGDIIQIGYTLLAYTDSDFAKPKHAQAFVDKMAKRYAGVVDDLEQAQQKRMGKALDATMEAPRG